MTHPTTPRHQAFFALREVERTLRQIIEHSTNLFYMHTADHVLTYVSPQSRQYFDCEPEEALVRWTDFITDHPINRAAVEITQRAIDTGERQPAYEVECISRTGRKVWVEVNETPIVKDGKTIAVVGSLTDITERKHAEEELRHSEERYRRLYRETPVMLHSIDHDGRLLSVSNFWLDTLGYERTEVLGRMSTDFLTEESRNYAKEVVLPEFFRTGFCKEIPYQLVKKNGAVLDVLLSAVAERDNEGAVVRSLAVMIDVTERNKAEEELRRSEERYRRLYKETPAMLHSIDHDGCLVSVSNHWLEMLGYERSEVLGRRITEFFTEVSRRYAEEVVLPEFFRTGFVKEVSYQLVKKNGEVLDTLLSAIAERDQGGEVIRSLAVIVDVTERKRAQKEIEKLNADLAARAIELENVNQELKAFSYTVSHDLRKPLTVINCYSQVTQELCGDNLNIQCRGYLEEISDAVLRMSDTIDALLNLSCVSNDELRRETVDLSDIVNAVTSELSLAEPGRQVTFRISNGVIVYGDARLLRVVLENLLGNAWKYTATREEATIEFGVANMDGKTTCFVRDNGVGFDMADAGKIFAPFQRLPGTNKFKGHGIGLATVERIIRRHGGQIWAEAAPGDGATFYFTLPEKAP